MSAEPKSISEVATLSAGQFWAEEDMFLSHARNTPPAGAILLSGQDWTVHTGGLRVPLIENAQQAAVGSSRRYRGRAWEVGEEVAAITTPRTLESKSYKKIERILELNLETIEDPDYLATIQSNIQHSLMFDSQAGNKIIEAISKGEVTSEGVYVLCDILGRVSYIKDKALNILTTLLNSSSVYVRDAAVLGLALLHDKRALPALQEHIKKETWPSLLSTFEDAIEQISH